MNNIKVRKEAGGPPAGIGRLSASKKKKHSDDAEKAEARRGKITQDPPSQTEDGPPAARLVPSSLSPALINAKDST